MSEKRDVWQERLNEFKGSEQAETVLMLSGSASLMRIALAWSGMSVIRKAKLKPCVAKDTESVWRWLWDHVEYSQEDLMNRIPGATAQTPRNFAALVANRVLYPDGTLNSFAGRYLKERVLDAFGIRKKTHRLPTV